MVVDQILKDANIELHARNVEVASWSTIDCQWSTRYILSKRVDFLETHMHAASDIDDLWSALQIHQAGRRVADIFHVNEVTRHCSVTEDNDRLAAEAMFESCPDDALSPRPGLAWTIRIGDSQDSDGD